MHYLIVGASQNLGKAMAEVCCNIKGSSVTGLARSEKQRIIESFDSCDQAVFTYHQIDITSPECILQCSTIAKTLPKESLCLIFNAATMEPDITASDKSLLLHTYLKVCETGIAGFGRIISVFEKHLMQYGGKLVVISSTSSLLPLDTEKKIAYPAQKAFLNMALRALRFAWPHHIKIITVILGHIGKNKYPNAPGWLIPSYIEAAKKIISSIHRPNCSNTVYIPGWCYAYKIACIAPDFFLGFIFEKMMKLLSKKTTPQSERQN